MTLDMCIFVQHGAIFVPRTQLYSLYPVQLHKKHLEALWRYRITYVRQAPFGPQLQCLHCTGQSRHHSRLNIAVHRDVRWTGSAVVAEGLL